MIRWLIEVSSILLIFILKDSLTLKNVLLTIQPHVVQRLHNSTLHCSYDLEGAQLYSVKWYRGRHEFYRFTPSESPPTKVFPYAGIRVDIYKSNSSQVVLVGIEFNLAGVFQCEVTTMDEPAVTGTDSQSMIVVQLPDFPPTISVSRTPLDYGDTLRANCTSSPSRPPTMLTFVLNNLTVARSKALFLRSPKDMGWSDLNLELILSEIHFSTNGRLILQCVAKIMDIYREEAVLELESVRAPIPERVSAFSGTSIISNTNNRRHNQLVAWTVLQHLLLHLLLTFAYSYC